MVTRTPVQPEQSIVALDAAEYPALLLDPDTLKEAFDENLAGEQLSFSDLRRIKVPAGGAETWSIPNVDGGKPTGASTFQGVIAHTELGRVMWLKEVGKGNTSKSGPDCSGSARYDGSWFGSKSQAWIKAAAAGLADKDLRNDGPMQGCEDCPFSQFGSGKNGKGQKCQQKRVFYIATEDSLLPTALVAPVMSLKAAKKYLLGLSTTLVQDGEKKRALQYHEVMTEFGLEADSNGENDFARITFRKAAVLPLEQRAAFALYRKSIKSLVSGMSKSVLAETAPAAQADDYNDFDGFDNVQVMDLDEELPTAED
jgi:hypothetical protein